MTDAFRKIIALADQCLLPKLAKNVHECDYHAEYQLRENNLKKHFDEFLHLFTTVDLNQPTELTSNVLAIILLLYFELQSQTVESSMAKECAEKLNNSFKVTYDMTVDELLQSDVFKSQDIFDITLKELHKRMTIDDFKKYPGLINVYCAFMKNVKNYKITLNPPLVLPVSLILIEDYISTNKLKGLQCCSAILQCLNPTDFCNGNYYEVVYSSLKKSIVERDIEVTRLSMECILKLLRLLPINVMKDKLDDIHCIILEQLMTESNLYRKVECFLFISKIIHMHGINCIKKKSFKTIICDNIDLCTDEAVREILLQHVIECLQTWLKYCWPIWKLSSDQKLVSSLFKILYLCEKEGTRIQIQDVIVVLISLCSEEEQKEIYRSLEITSKCSNSMFLTSIETIKQHIKT